MQIKFFQPLHDIVRTLEFVYMPRGFSHDVDYPTIASYHPNLTQPTQEEIKEERDAIAYVSCLKRGFTFDQTPLSKPSVEVATRAFQRLIEYADVVKDTCRNDRNKNPLIQKQVACAYHYIFQFSKEVWFEKLPETIPTVQEQNFASLENEAEIEIRL